MNINFFNLSSISLISASRVITKKQSLVFLEGFLRLLNSLHFLIHRFSPHEWLFHQVPFSHSVLYALGYLRTLTFKFSALFKPLSSTTFIIESRCGLFVGFFIIWIFVCKWLGIATTTILSFSEKFLLSLILFLSLSNFVSRIPS